jgi:DNA-binding GntR family transcriptional regulator
MYMIKRDTGTLRFQAYRAIKEKIIYLDLRPGDKISENELAGLLKVSRTPVREALLMLEHEKLVVCSDSLGFQVTRFNSKDIHEYFSLRNAIEEFALSLVMENITEEEIAALKANVTAGKRIVAAGDVKAIVRCETEFHEILYAAAKSDLLFETISNLVGRFQWLRALALTDPGAAANSLSQHRKMVGFIETKNVTSLKKAMKSHLKEAEGRLLRLPDILL